MPPTTVQSAIPASMLVAQSATTFAVAIPPALDIDYMVIADLAPKGTMLGPEHGPVGYLSVRDDGSGYDRVSGVGQFETCTKSGAFLVFTGWGNRRFLIPWSA